MIYRTSCQHRLFNDIKEVSLPILPASVKVVGLGVKQLPTSTGRGSKEAETGTDLARTFCRDVWWC